MKLLRLEFKSDNTMKSKAIKYIFEKLLPHYEYNRLILIHIKTKEAYCVSCKKIVQIKILMSEELNNAD